jgi:Na+-transporting NADH:ubiquinone oxidoreductase subunit NqrB
MRGDPRNWQIIALGLLLAFNIAALDYGARLLPSLVAIACSVLTQLAFSRRKRAELRSPLITGLSLSLLLRGDGLWVIAAGAVCAVASKFLLRARGRHFWNPAAFGIVAMLLTGHAWVTPGQWGSSAVLAAFFALLAAGVLSRAARVNTALLFLLAYAALLALRAVKLGDPWTIPFHQMQSGSILLFAFFMVTDPKTTPRRFAGRLLFVVAVAVLAYRLAFIGQIRPALYWALFVLAPAVPALDWIGDRLAGSASSARMFKESLA